MLGRCGDRNLRAGFVPMASIQAVSSSLGGILRIGKWKKNSSNPDLSTQRPQNFYTYTPGYDSAN